MTNALLMDCALCADRLDNGLSTRIESIAPTGMNHGSVRGNKRLLLLLHSVQKHKCTFHSAPVLACSAAVHHPLPHRLIIVAPLLLLDARLDARQPMQLQLQSPV